MRIGLFTDTYLPDINGVVSSIHTLRLELEKHGHEVYVITTRPGLVKIVQEGNVYRLPGIELKFLYGYIATSPIHMRAIEDIENMHLDIIHAHTEFGIGIFARIVSKKLGIPLVSTYHTTYEDYTHYVNFFNLDSVDNMAKKVVSHLSKLYGDSCISVIVPSIKTYELLKGYNVTSKLAIVPTGLDLDKFDPKKTSKEEINKIRLEAGLKDSEYGMLFVGRLAKEKAVDLVIRGFVKVKENKLPCKLVIVGAGPNEDDLKELTKELNLDDYVIFLGKKPSDIIQHYYHSFDMFISASLTETQGLTFIEALSAGLPVFARHDEAINNIINAGSNGYYFKGEDDLYQYIQNYINLSEDEKKKIRMQAYQDSKLYGSEEFYNKVIDVYEDAIKIYSDYYVLAELKHRNDTIKLTLKKPNGQELQIVTSLDMFYDLGLRKNMRVNDDQLAILNKEEKKVLAYQACIRKITFKDRTVKEIYDFLTQETELDIREINDIVEKLEKSNLLDDKKYANGFVEHAMASLYGKKKIENTLKKKGVSYDIIEEALSREDESYERQYATKYANKVKNQIKGKSIKETKANIYRKMIAQGYTSDMANDIINELSFVDEELNEINSLKKLAIKAQKKYTNKYSGSMLRNMVFKACIKAGYRYEDIYIVLNEMEWEDEQKNY